MSTSKRGKTTAASNAGSYAPYAHGVADVDLGDSVSARRAPVFMAEIDDLVGGFPGPGACVPRPPGEDALGHREQMPLADIAFWSGSLDHFASSHGCDECRSAHQAGSDPAERAACSQIGAGGCEYGQVAELIQSLRREGDLDPIVVYHQPRASGRYELQDPGRGDYAVDDGYHRISAYLSEGRGDIPAIVFHDGLCCAEVSA
jgi:hypothetical protein